MSEPHVPSFAPASPPGPAAPAGVPGRVPEVGDLDPRLTQPASRPVLGQIALDHDPGGATACPRCGWSLSAARPQCPSRAIAHAVRDQRPVPGWLSGLAHAVPGAVTQAPVSSPGSQEAEDGQLGLFPAPPQTRPACGEDGAR